MSKPIKLSKEYLQRVYISLGNPRFQMGEYRRLAPPLDSLRFDENPGNDGTIYYFEAYVDLNEQAQPCWILRIPGAEIELG